MSFKKGIVYVCIANFINIFISLFTGFLLPKFLSVDTYANIKLFQMYVTYIGILHFGFSDGMYIKYGGKDLDILNKDELNDEFNTFKLFQMMVSIICILVSIILKNTILFFCFLVILPINIGNYIRNLYQATGRFDRYSKYMNINTIMIFIINITILFILRSDNYYIYIIFYCVAYFLYGFIVNRELKQVLGKKTKSIDFKYMFDNIKNGFLLMIGNFANVIFTTIDRLFVKYIMDNVKFAYYSFAVSIENLLNTFILPISTVMYNYLCKHNSEEEVIKIKKIIMIFAAFLMVLAYPSIFVIRTFIVTYLESINVLILLFGAQYVSIMIKTIHINIYKANKKQNLYFVIMFIIILLSILLNIMFYILDKTIVSFALATLVTNLIWFIINEICLKKYKLNNLDYLFFVLQLICFICFTLIFNCIIGCFIYILVTIFNVVFFERKEFIYLIKECIKFIKEKRRKM